jgi:glycosyltransferase involved in cell wall biosynthesis
MHVVIISDFADMKGGAPRVALESARALAEAGVAVSYIYAIGSKPHPILDHPLIKSVGFGMSDVWELPAMKGFQAGLWNAAAAKRVRILLASQPRGETIVHLHQWTRAFSASIFLALVKSGHPLITTLHDYFIACPNGVYYRFDLEQPCEVQPMSWACMTARCDPRSSLVKLVRIARTSLMNMTLRDADIDLIHVSDRAQETIKSMLPMNARHHRVDNPVNVVKRLPAQIQPEAKIAFIGRMVREKGADLVAAAAKRAGVEVMFIGDGPLTREIKAAYPDSECLGWKDISEVDSLLRSRVRAIVAPSRWYETGPLTVYEAMASGIPAIVSDRAGAAEKIVHGETGFIVEPEVEPLARAFQDLANTQRAQMMGRAAYEKYWANPPSLDAHASRLIEVYQSIMKSREIAEQHSRYAPDGRAAPSTA